jgi:hypothetical protein
MKTRVLNFKLVCIVALAFSFVNLHAQTDKRKSTVIDTSECLEFTGSFDGSVKDFDGTYTVKLYLDNKLITTQMLKVKKKFAVLLNKNSLYTIKVEKDGYIPKTVSINTTIPDKVEITDLFRFHFETNLISNDLSIHFDDDDIDFPVALVSYGKKCDCFEFNKQYTESLIHRMVNDLMFGG